MNVFTHFTNPVNNMRLRFLLLTLLLSYARATAGYAPPIDSVAGERVASALAEDLAGGRYAEAAARAEELLANPATRLIRDEKRLVAVDLWVDSLLTRPADRAAFTQAYSQRYGADADQSWLELKRSQDVAALMRIARRYPWTPAADRALLEAAKLSAASGDGRNAKAIARQLPESSAGEEVKALLSLPDDGVATQPLFSAPWYQAYQPHVGQRVVPIAAGDAIFVASPRSVIAIGSGGKTIWSTGEIPAEKPPAVETDAKGKPLPPLPVDESLYQAAAWSDLEGAPQVIISRVTTPEESVLRAYHASDGRLLWQSGKDDQTKNLYMAGAAKVIGRYTYSVAVRYSENHPARTELVALETTTGRLLLSTDLGGAGPAVNAHGQSTMRRVKGVAAIVAADVFPSHMALSADDRSIYAIFAGGSIVCVDRFGGGVQWVTDYPVRKARSEQDIQREREGKNPPVYRRWQDAVLIGGGWVAAAPIDSDSLVAIDAKSGLRRWVVDTARGAVPLQIKDDGVIVLGKGLKRLDVKEGSKNEVEETEIPRPSGPVLVEGDNVILPVVGGLVQMPLAGGDVTVRREGKTPSLDTLLRQNGPRTALEKTDLLKYFDIKAILAPPEDFSKSAAGKQKSLKDKK
ncbi:MAG TPA: PQQ-binding-like beta-propeller repeat protein [Tepidisphaeraceae bacterium]